MSDGYKVIYSAAAFDDIRNIYSYIALELQVPDTAQSQVNRIRKATIWLKNKRISSR